MPFEMSLKALIEEELIEAKVICDDFAENADSVIKLIHDNELLDRKNDKTRLEVRQFLHSAIRAYNMRDYEGMNNDIHAAIQRLHDQEQIDLSDDFPRQNAIVKLSVMQNHMVHCSKRLRKFLEKLNGAIRNESEPSVPKS